MPKVKMPDGTVVAFPDDMPKDKIKSLILTKFPQLGNAPGPRAQQSPGLINFPTAAGNTPASAAVTDMQPGGPPPQPQPAASGAPSPAPQASAPQAPAQPATPDGGSGNWLIDAAKTMAGSLASYGSSTLGALPVVGPGLNTIANTAEVGVNHLLNSGPQNLGDAAAQQNALRQQYPVANALGTVTGTVAPALIPGVGEAMGAGEAATGAANVGKALAIGSTTAAADTYERTGDVGDAAAAGFAGGLLGPIVGKVGGIAAGAVGKAMSSSSKRAWAYIASKMGVPANDLVKYVQAHAALNNGRAPSLQQVLDGHAAGAVQDFAKSNPQTTMMLQQAQQAENNALPAQAAQVVERAGIPRPTPKFLSTVPPHEQSPEALLNARDANTTAAYDKFRSDPIDLPEELRTNRMLYNEAPSISVDPSTGAVSKGTRFKLQAIQNAHDAAAHLADVAGNPESTADDIAAARQAAADAVQAANAAGPVTVGEVDVIRKGLNNLGNGSSENAGEARNTATALGNFARAVHPAYGQALEDYAAADRYRLGFEHSYYTGAPAHTATDANIREALATPEGAAGHAAGVATNLRNAARSGPQGALRTMQQVAVPGDEQTALAAAATNKGNQAPEQAQSLVNANRAVALSTPQTIKPPDEGSSSRNIAAGALEAGVGLHLSASGRFARAASDFFRHNTFPPAVQREIALGLTSHDPAVQLRTIEMLHHAQVDAKSLKNLQNAFAASAGGAVGQSVAASRSE